MVNRERENQNAVNLLHALRNCLNWFKKTVWMYYVRWKTERKAVSETVTGRYAALCGNSERLDTLNSYWKEHNFFCSKDFLSQLWKCFDWSVIPSQRNPFHSITAALRCPATDVFLTSFEKPSFRYFSTHLILLVL